MGKLSFEADKLVENVEAFISLIRKRRPATTKGMYIKKVSLSATMSPAVELDLASIQG